MEIELKLALDQDAAPAVGRHPLIANYREGAPRSREVENHYVDSPALDLWHHGVELRLRRDGTRHWQTLKRAPIDGTRSRSSGGLHRLDEWEMPLPADTLDIPALVSMLPATAADVARLLRQVSTAGELGVRVSTLYRRTTWRLRSANGDLVEMARDTGEVCAGGRKLPLCEVELELKFGNERSLLELAVALQRDLPLRPELRGKAERGFALLARVPATPPRPARPVPLEHSMSRAAALRLIVEECLAQVQANEAGVIGSSDVEYVHQMRVGLRRLRSALGLFKDFANPPPALIGEVKWSAAMLGGARDAEVLVHQTLARMPAPPSAALQAAALAAAQRARGEAVQTVRSSRHVAWQLALMAWACGLSEPAAAASLPRIELTARGLPRVAKTAARDTLPGYALAKLRRLRKRLVRRGRELPGTDATVRHETRIAAKKLRYATEMLGPLCRGWSGRERQRALRALSALQEQLGLLNDAEVAAAGLARLADSDAALASAAAHAQGWLAAEAEQRVRRLGKVWRRVHRNL